MAGANKGKLTVRIIGDEKSFKGALDKARRSAEGFGAALPGLLGAAGAAGGAALAAGLLEAFERDAATDKLGAALGLSPRETEAAGRIAGEVWSEAFGDSFGEVNQAVEGVASTLGSFSELGEDAIADLTRDALTVADVFNLDVSEAISAAGVLLNSGLVSDADEAFDTITRGLQEMPAALRGELLEASTEYGTFFDALGFDASQAFEVLVRGAEDGMYGIDKTGDAIKEFGIRATDMSNATVKAFDTIGMDAGTMAERLLEGGETAREAFDDIVTGLLDIEDPVERANTSIALFGTPLEDLSVNEIPQFLEQLTNIEAGLGDVEGATDRVADTAYDNISTRWTELWRGAQQAFLTFADENVIPAAERVVEAFEQDGLAGAMDMIREEWDRAWPSIERWLEDTVAPALVEFGGTVGGLMAEALWEGFKAGVKALFTSGSPFDGVIPDWDPLNVGGAVDAVFGNREPEPSRPSGRTAEPPNQTRSGGGRRSGNPNLMFHDGGVVPGRPGQEVPILAMAGETVLPTHKPGQYGGVTVHNLTVGTAEDADEMVRELRKLAMVGAYGG